ncbi:hypothetical protein ASC75_08480 [Aminobacter sp. DSM 101952]|nr:hypothetical protein ASC75_08480 [Aminobacter sp. DSM 101952]
MTGRDQSQFTNLECRLSATTRHVQTFTSREDTQLEDLNTPIQGTQAAPQNDEERLRRAIAAADAELAASSQRAGTERRAEKGIIQKGADLWKSAGVGIAKAGIETKDFFLGEPAEADKSDLRRGVEQLGRDLSNESVANSLTMGTTHIITGLIGAGKLMAPVKALQKVKSVRGGVAAYETARGALAGAVVLDPHEARLSDLIESFPDLQNPVTEYLSSDPTDSAAEGRFKNALEGIGADFALLGAIRVIKFLRSGDTEAATREIAKLEKARQANADEFGMDFTGGSQPLAKDEPVVAPQGVTGTSPQVTLVDEVGIQPAAKDEPVQAPPSQEGPDAQAVEDFDPHASGWDFTERPPHHLDETAEDLSVFKERQFPDDKVEAYQRGLAEESTPRQASSQMVPEEGVIEQIGAAPQPVNPKTGEALLPTEKVAPKLIRTKEVAEKELNDILDGSRSDSEAIRQYGSVAAARASGHKFAQVKLPWQKLYTQGGTGEFMSNAVRVLEGRFNAAKGGAILKDTRVRALVNDLSEQFGEDPAMVLGDIADAGKNASKMVAQMEAGLRIGNRMFNDANDLAARIRLGNFEEFGGSPEAAKSELQARLALAFDTLASANSIRSNAGRALRRNRSEFAISKKDLAKLRTMDPDKVTVIMERAGGDPKKVSMILNATWSRRVMDEVAFLLSNNLLWLWPTHLTNITSSAMMIVGRPTEKLLGSFAVGPQTGNIMRRQALKEYSATVAALGDGWTAMVEAFKRGDSLLSPHNTELFQSGSLGATLPRIQWKPIKTVSDMVENALNAVNYRNLVGLPTRTLGAVDEFFKTLRYRAVVQADAAVEAAQRGLSGREYEAFITRRLEDAIDPATGRALDERALREAQVTTFQQELLPGTLGATIQQVRSRHPILHLVLPFVKTPINVLRYGVKMTPGLNLIQKEYLDAIRGAAGPEAQAQAVGQMALGSVFMGLAANLALSGKLTGAGPADPKLRGQLTATGWQPFSYVVQNGDGARTYVPLGRADPVGLSLTMVASIVEAMQADPEADMEVPISALGYALARSFGDRTFLANANQAIQALSDPERRGSKWLGNTMGNLVPASSLLRGTNPDPYLREARSVLDMALKDIPGYSETLPARRDAFGEPLFRRIGLLTDDDADVVETEHNRMILETGKAGVGSPSPEFEGLDLRDIILTTGPNAGRNAYEVLQELSGQIPGQPSLKQALRKTIESAAYQDMPDGDPNVKGTRLAALGSITERYRRAAKQYLVVQNAELRKLIGARQREANGARLEKRRQRDGNVPKTFSEMLQPQR